MNEKEKNMSETEYLLSILGIEEKIIEGLNTPLEECIKESEVEW